MEIKIGFTACLAHQVVLQFQRAGEKKTFSGLDGEAACEGHNLNPTQCLAVGCCHWDNDQVGFSGFLFSGFLTYVLATQCWSSVGKRPCQTSSPPPTASTTTITSLVPSSGLCSSSFLHTDKTAQPIEIIDYT